MKFILKTSTLEFLGMSIHISRFKNKTWMSAGFLKLLTDAQFFLIKNRLLHQINDHMYNKSSAQVSAPFLVFLGQLYGISRNIHWSTWISHFRIHTFSPILKQLINNSGYWTLYKPSSERNYQAFVFSPTLRPFDICIYVPIYKRHLISALHSAKVTVKLVGCCLSGCVFKCI